MVFWHRQSCWRGDQSAHSVGRQLHFLWACGGQSGGCVLDGRGDDSWKNRCVADSLCSVDCKVTGGLSAGGGVYQKPLHYHLAGGRVCAATGISSESEPPPGRSALLRHAGAVSGASGILGGADAGRHPDNGAGCGAGAVYSAAKRRPDVHGGLRRRQRHRNCGHCRRNAPESGDLPAGRLDPDPRRSGSHRRGRKSLKPGEGGCPHPPTGGRDFGGGQCRGGIRRTGFAFDLRQDKSAHFHHRFQ